MDNYRLLAVALNKRKLKVPSIQVIRHYKGQVAMKKNKSSKRRSSCSFYGPKANSIFRIIFEDRLRAKYEHWTLICRKFTIFIHEQKWALLITVLRSRRTKEYTHIRSRTWTSTGRRSIMNTNWTFPTTNSTHLNFFIAASKNHWNIFNWIFYR